MKADGYKVLRNKVSKRVWGESKLAMMVCSGSLAPRFVNKDYVTAEIILALPSASQSTRLVTGCVEYARVSSTWRIKAVLLPYGCVCWVGHERREYRVSTAMTAASARREYCYGCCVSQKRSCAVLVLLWLLIQLLPQPGENKYVCNSCSSSSLLPAS